MSDREEPLGGGYVNAVVRVGSTVRRRLTEPRPFAHDLLHVLEDAGWSGAPRFLGFDEEGREVLSWIEGHVPWSGTDDPPGIYDDGAVAAVARLVRALHDLTAASPLAEGGEVVCHNDLSPKNTVYQQVRVDDVVAWRPIAFIDWDAAAPGLRIHDVAHVAWQWAANTATSPAAAAQRVRVVVEAYGLDRERRSNLVDTILWWQDRCWRGIQAQIDEGNPAVHHLLDANAVGAVRADFEWTLHHRTALDAALA